MVPPGDGRSFIERNVAIMVAFKADAMLTWERGRGLLP